ncbi:hypothetical protein T02_16167 [Trichinella nativa]|uniref:Uncharacterized protein n=1 Tax=Trichinella nativa TaxID=6335 RepID=A0A0V1LNT5_9BILA|nr:hypothetical protein T06_295 [Trichinella sp. T6]KRZ61131.1 hypothetical protein T02_16167 [Trichinella nativa]
MSLYLPGSRTGSGLCVTTETSRAAWLDSSSTGGDGVLRPDWPRLFGHASGGPASQSGPCHQQRFFESSLKAAPRLNTSAGLLFPGQCRQLVGSTSCWISSTRFRTNGFHRLAVDCIQASRLLDVADQPSGKQSAHELQPREAQAFHWGNSGLRCSQPHPRGSRRGLHPQVDHRTVGPFRGVTERMKFDPLHVVQLYGNQGPGEPDEGKAKAFRRLRGVVRPTPVLAPIATGRGFLPARGTVRGIRSGRRYSTRRSAADASCSLPPGYAFPGLRTSGSLRGAPNGFPTSSRADPLPPIWSSPGGGLGELLVHCWPTCATGIHRRRAKTTAGPPSSGLHPQSRMKWPSRPCTCDSTLLRPPGVWPQDSVWRTSSRCRPATLHEGDGKRGSHAGGQFGDSAPLPTGGSAWSPCTERLRQTPLDIFARRPPPGRPRGGAGTTSSPADLPPARVPPSLRRSTASLLSRTANGLPRAHASVAPTPGAGVGRANRPPGTQGRLTKYLPSSRRSSSSNAFIAAVPSAAVSSAGAIPSASISQNLRKASSSEPSLCNKKTPASGARFRTAPPHVIQPRRVSTATDPPVALLMRPVTTHRPPAALSAAVPPRLRSLPVSHPGTPSTPSGPLHIPEGSLAPASGCRHLDGLSPPLLPAEIPLCAIGAPAPHDLPVS